MAWQCHVYENGNSQIAYNVYVHRFRTGQKHISILKAPMTEHCAIRTYAYTAQADYVGSDLITCWKLFWRP